MAVAERSDQDEIMAMSVSIIRRAAADGTTKLVRECANLTQAEFGNWVGVAAASVARWEAGARTPRGEPGRQYARAIVLLLETINGDCDPAVLRLRDSLRDARHAGANA